MIKKLTVRLDLDKEDHQLAYELLTVRDRKKYRSFADYIVPAVLRYQQQNGQIGYRFLSEQEKQQLLLEIFQELKKEKEKRYEPGI